MLVEVTPAPLWEGTGDITRPDIVARRQVPVGVDVVREAEKLGRRFVLRDGIGKGLPFRLRRLRVIAVGVQPRRGRG